MKVLKPFFYDEFSCVGGECIDTCCAGWRIEIDKDTLDKYEKVNGSFGIRLKENIQKGDKNHFKLDGKRRCPFLNEASLCDIYINIGEDKLSKTCTSYPRTIKKYEDVYEQNLALSCPEIAKIIVTDSQPMDFCFGETEEGNPDTQNTNLELFDVLVMGRGTSVDLMQCREIAIWKRSFLCIVISDTIQKFIDRKELSGVKNALDKLKEPNYLMQYLVEMDKLPGNTGIKLEYYKLILNTLSSIDLPNPVFIGYLNEAICYINQLTEEYGNDILKKLILSYDNCNIDKDYIAENFMVYNLFHYYMTAYKTNDLHKNIIMIVVFQSLLKLFQMIRWWNNGETITDKERIEIIYSYSRAVEHVSDNYNKIYNAIKDKGFDQLPYLLSLIK